MDKPQNTKVASLLVYSYHLCKFAVLWPPSFSKIKFQLKYTLKDGLSFTVLVVYSIWSKSGSRKSRILPPKCQIQIVKLQNLNQLKVLQLPVPILALKVTRVVLQKAQNRRLIMTTVIYIIRECKFCQFFRIILENYTFFTIFWANRIPLSFSEFREILPFSASRESYVPRYYFICFVKSCKAYTWRKREKKKKKKRKKNPDFSPPHNLLCAGVDCRQSMIMLWLIHSLFFFF